jgi:hypothetical protein
LDPAVYIMPPNPGLPYSLSSGGAGTTRTFDQSASSSSARMSGSEVSDPCPISTEGDWMKIVPSIAMLTQGLKAGAFPADAASAALAGSMVRAPAHPASATPNVRPAAPTMNSRRVSSGVTMAQPSLTARSIARTIR